MAQEIKNTFLKSKMNKDLDDRILPNGEYRDALNISVGRSEDNDVGALENIIGNDLVTGTDIGDGLTVIGLLEDNARNTLYVFLTNNTDPNPSNPTNAPEGTKHFIYAYNSNATYTKLVQGAFLNFSTTNRIIGANILESLLFWTDNRNQPRKINVNLARAFEEDPTTISTSGLDYYTEEHQISVAKYSPYAPIDLYNRINLQMIPGATTLSLKVAGDRVEELTAFIGASVVCLESSPPTQGLNFVKVASVALVGGETVINVSPAMQIAPAAGLYVSLISSTMSNKNDDDTWPGDPDYLEDKFVRFSYRFKFDDNEYSLMAPFTQITYIPKQNGYFTYGDEDAAYRSTILGFMENSVQNIGLNITLPCKAKDLIRKYKISEIEILFRESDGIAVKVIESVKASTISAESGTSNIYNYEYQSRKPYRTLPEAQTVRVYDKVPVRAFAQETSGNRIIYGNFADKHTPPDNINYNCKIAKKSSTGAYNNFVEYPNHSVKRNRNYQVGFVLADKFGRQSPVILSSVDLGEQSGGQFFSGSTIYSPYDIVDTDTDVKTWFGDTIQVLVNEQITSNRDLQSGTPGLYAEPTQRDSSGEGFAIAPNLQGPAFITNTTYTFQLNDDPTTGFPNNINVPAVGDYMRGAYQDFVKVTESINPALSTWIITTEGRVSDVYLRTDDLPSTTPDLKFAYTINDVGWYSYRIVVKQTEQDYYNVYLPGILNGYPGQSRSGTDEGGEFPDDEIDLTAHTVLFNDNINKIPRDLNKIGDQDRQYRSSVELYGRVTNTMIGVNNQSVAEPSNLQYFPRLDYSGKNAITHTAIAISPAKDFDMGFTQLSGDGSGSGNPTALDGNKVFYQIDTNPLIARISTTEKSIGWGAEQDPNPTQTVEGDWIWNMLPYLAIYETEPVESLLDIYWETTTSGLLADLNADIATENDGIFAFENLTWEFLESTATNDSVTPSFFSPINNQGLPFTTPVAGELLSATNVNGDPVTFFALEQGTGSNLGKFVIKYTGEGEVFLEGSGESDIYSFVLRMVADGIITDIPLPGQQGGFGALQNVAPSFPTIPDLTKTIYDTILIPASTFSLANNGSVLNDNSQLVYSFIPTTPEDTIPTNWTMDPDNGQLTQNIPNTPSGGNFPGNGLGNYNITVQVTDANAETINNTSVPAYTSLLYEQDLTIRLQPAALNPELSNTSCVLTPTSSDPSSFSPTATDNWTSRLYYIGAQTYNDIEEFTDNGVDFSWYGGQPNATLSNPAPQDILNNFRIGTGAHTSGELAITFNLYKNNDFPNNTGFWESLFVLPVVNYWYRFVGATTWNQLNRGLEENETGLTEATLSGNGDIPPSQAGLITSPQKDFPNSTGSLATADSQFVRDRRVLNVPSIPFPPTWYQSVRAFNHGDFTQPPPSSGIPLPLGIEYCITVQGLQQQDPPINGSSSDVRVWIQVDDLRNPTCVPWQGDNAVTFNGAGNMFKYLRSEGNNSFYDWVDIPDGSPEVYSETPYGEHVNVFYTTPVNGDQYKPAEGNNFVSFRMPRDLPNGELSQWTSYLEDYYPAGDDSYREFIELAYLAQFDTDDGNKLPSLFNNSGTAAKQSMQPTPGIGNTDGETLQGGVARWRLKLPDE